MAGNSVILKPATEAILVSWHLVQALWAAGIPKRVLQFVPAPDNEVGQSLITDERTAAVILTGSIETAQLFLEWRPNLRLFAEPSGKNSLIITAMSDRDLAIKDLIRTAIGHMARRGASQIVGRTCGSCGRISASLLRPGGE
jgi:RHH-type proline utilization regulon transcriptional repressor/proline dehydrogenase/delta 1-pyrroline-5-carboxylate dehydrogenase